MSTQKPPALAEPPASVNGTTPTPARAHVTVRTLAAKRKAGTPITMLTAYDYPSAQLADEAGMDILLVGDSLAMVVLGHDNTLSVTVDEMLHHCRAVKRGARTAMLVGDMPFMSYQVDAASALRNAGRFLQEAGMDAVKLEGGRAVVPQVRAIVAAGIPVMGHIGLTPQSIHALGGFRVQGKTAAEAKRLLDDALALEEAGCFSIVLESVPDRLADDITRRLSIPTIGIGAGAGTSGQVLVFHDLLGLFERFTPKFVRRYAELGAAARAAITAYGDDVVAGSFPAPEHTFTMSDEAWQAYVDAASASPAPVPPDTSTR
ncbi:MAG: 3-methyl-2-oxobutanoate hydroxymethyltransferase [Ardenticatenales bacterium]